MGQILRRVKNATKKEKTCRKRMSPQMILTINTEELGTSLTAPTAVNKPLKWTSSIVGANGDM